jgi:hypothetical protein
MATAHELARKLLAGADYEVILMVGDGRGGRVRAVESMSGTRDDMMDTVTKPVIVIVPEPNRWDVDPYGR